MLLQQRPLTALIKQSFFGMSLIIAQRTQLKPINCVIVKISLNTTFEKNQLYFPDFCNNPDMFIKNWKYRFDFIGTGKVMPIGPI